MIIRRFFIIVFNFHIYTLLTTLTLTQYYNIKNNNYCTVRIIADSDTQKQYRQCALNQSMSESSLHHHQLVDSDFPSLGNDELNLSSSLPYFFLFIFYVDPKAYSLKSSSCSLLSRLSVVVAKLKSR